MIGDPRYEQAVRTLQHYLHENSLHGSRRKASVLRVFLSTTKPVNMRELLYLVKQQDPSVSFHTLYHAMKLFVAAGLASTVGPVRYRDAQRFTHSLPDCAHAHLACKDCGAQLSKEGSQ